MDCCGGVSVGAGDGSEKPARMSGFYVERRLNCFAIFGEFAQQNVDFIRYDFGEVGDVCL